MPMTKARVGQRVTVDGHESEGVAEVTLTLSHGGVLLDRRIGPTPTVPIGFRYWNVSSLSPATKEDG